MNFIVESSKYCISDKGRIYSKFQKKSGAPVEFVRIGIVRPESNAPIKAIEMLKFRELQPDDLRAIADLVDSYITCVYGESPSVFADHNVGIVGTS